MRAVRRFFKRSGRKAVFAAILFGAGVVLAASAWFPRVPEDVERAFLFQWVIKTADCAGEAWGTDLYFARENSELKNGRAQNINGVMMGRFAETILASAPWGRPLDDVKYAYESAYQEREEGLCEKERIFLQAQELWLNTKGLRSQLGSKDRELIRALREKERAQSSLVSEAQYRSLLQGKASGALKGRVLARVVQSEETKQEGHPLSEIKALEKYAKAGLLPPGIDLYLRELQRTSEDELFHRRVAVAGGHNKILDQYERAIERLSARDYPGFIAETEALLAQYPRKDFSPTLAYQIWSVLKVDQNAPGASAEQLARLKREYPLSRLSRPETVMKVYLPEEGKETGSARSEVFSGEAPLMIRGVREISPETQRTDERTPENLFDKMIQPINFVQGFFRSVSAEVFFKMGRFAAALEPDKIYTQVVDNSKARDCLEHFLPSFARKVINRYEVNFDGEGVTLSMEMNMGFSYLKVISRGAVIVRGGEGARHMELDLRDMKVQGMTVPATFLAQIENGVNDAERGANMPLDMVDIQYWPGSAKFVFKKKL